MQAYRKLAKTRHPDRGGSAAQFSQLQQAFEVLSDPRQREVYDAWARQTQFRYVPGATSQVRVHILLHMLNIRTLCKHRAEPLT